MTAAPPRAFVTGFPIAHSRSPAIHGFWLAEYGLPGSYERIEVHPDAIPAFLAALPESGFAGGNVTVPHKEAVFAHLAGGGHALSDEARRLGAVNTLRVLPDGRLHGHNTDGFGYVESVDEAIGPGWERGVRTATLIGAGGAARAVAGALLDRGVERVRVANRTAERADALRDLAPDRIESVVMDDVASWLPATDLLVNTTSLGMAGQPPLVLDLSPLPDGAIVSDIVYIPAETPFLAAARARGLRRVGGLGMLLHQAVPGFEAWFGRRPVVTPALWAAVEADIARGA